MTFAGTADMAGSKEYPNGPQFTEAELRVRALNPSLGELIVEEVFS